MTYSLIDRLADLGTPTAEEAIAQLTECAEECGLLSRQVSHLDNGLADLEAQLAAKDALIREMVGALEIARYVTQDAEHNRLTPRIVDIAYSAFMRAKGSNSEDGGPTDWFNDTRPMVMEETAKITRDISAALTRAKEMGYE